MANDISLESSYALLLVFAKSRYAVKMFAKKMFKTDKTNILEKPISYNIIYKIIAQF